MSIYDFEIEDIHGKKVSLSKYKDHVMLIVNTATECGFAYQFEVFQNLYDQFKDKKFIVLAFPSNSFKQEPDDNETVFDKCSTLYKITYPLFDKVSVQGDDIHPLFNYLVMKQNRFFRKAIPWNFTKFLIDREGNIIKRLPPRTSGDKLEKVLLRLL